MPRFDFCLTAAGDEEGSVLLSMPTYRGIPLHSGAFCMSGQREVLETNFPPRIVARLKYVQRSVPVIRLDTLNLSPTVVKIDAEGYDLKIIYGMTETIRRCRPVMMVENNPSTVKTITELLGKMGYGVYEFDYAKNRFCAYRGGHTRNLFFTVSDPLRESRKDG